VTARLGGRKSGRRPTAQPLGSLERKGQAGMTPVA
jgi:hypothetical protein